MKKLLVPLILICALLVPVGMLGGHLLPLESGNIVCTGYLWQSLGIASLYRDRKLGG